MENPSGTRPLATPCRCKSGIPLGSACHGPTHSLRILRGQITGDREETGFLAGIHDRQLLAVQSIGTIGVDLVHHVDERPSQRNKKTLLPKAWKTHLGEMKGIGSGQRDGILDSAYHVKTGFALPLRQKPSTTEEHR